MKNLHMNKESNAHNCGEVYDQWGQICWLVAGSDCGFDEIHARIEQELASRAKIHRMFKQLYGKELGD